MAFDKKTWVDAPDGWEIGDDIPVGATPTDAAGFNDLEDRIEAETSALAGDGGGSLAVGNDVDVTATTASDGSAIATADPTKAAWISLRFAGGASGGWAGLGSNDDTFNGRQSIPADGHAQIDFICKAGEQYFVTVNGTVTIAQAIERSLG